MENPQPVIGVNFAIVKDGKVLFIKCRDFEAWCLPGGEGKAGEPLTEAAMRKASES